jgi:hypothetical protein
LKNYANPLSEGDNIRARSINILSIEGDGSFGSRMRDEFIHPIENTEKGRFSTTRRTDQSGDLVRPNGDIDPFEGLSRTIIKIETPCFHLWDGIRICH